MRYLRSPLQRGPFAARHPAGLLPFVFVCQIDRRDRLLSDGQLAGGRRRPGCRRAGQFGQEGHRVVGHAQQESPPGGINK